MRASIAILGALSLFLGACAGLDAKRDTVVDTDSGGDTSAPAPLFQTRPPLKSKPAHVVGGFSIDVPKQTLSPGEETEPCYILPLEIQGPSRVVGGARLTVGRGMHHGNVVTRPKTGEGVRPCTAADSGNLGGGADEILAGGAVLFGSSTQIEGEEWQRFPDGIGYPIRDGFEIVARMHYLNTSSDTLEIAPHYEWFTVDEASVDHLVGPFAWALKDWTIPPQSDFTAAGSCNVLGPMHLVHVLPHMHRMGKRFTGTLLGGEHDGASFLDSPGYDPEDGVMLEYDPPLDLSIADQFRFSCEWRNTLDKPLVSGVGDNEMCILFGYAYPFENAYSALSAGEGKCLLMAPPMPE